MLVTFGTQRVIKTFLSTLWFCNNDADVLVKCFLVTVGKF